VSEPIYDVAIIAPAGQHEDLHLTLRAREIPRRGLYGKIRRGSWDHKQVDEQVLTKTFPSPPILLACFRTVPARTLVEMKSSAGESCQRHLRFDQRFYFSAAATFTRTCSVNGRA